MNSKKIGNMFFEGKLWGKLNFGPFRIALDKFPASCKKQAIVDVGEPYYGYGGVVGCGESAEITTVIAIDGVLLVSLSLDEIESLCHAMEESAKVEKIEIEIDEETSATIKGTIIEVPVIAIFQK